MVSKFYGLSNIFFMKFEYFSPLNCPLTIHGPGEQHPIKMICRFSLIQKAQQVLLLASSLNALHWIFSSFSFHSVFSAWLLQNQVKEAISILLFIG